MRTLKLAGRMFGLLALAWATGGTLECLGQLPAPQTYSSYYNRELQEMGRPDISPRTYTYNKYYYNNPAVSPYMNLLRTPGFGQSAYSQYVQPQEQRRANYEAKNLERRAPGGTGNAGLARPPAPSSGAMQNHWYGSRQQMGL